MGPFDYDRYLVDQLIRLIHDHVVGDIYRSSNRSSGEAAPAAVSCPLPPSGLIHRRFVHAKAQRREEEKTRGQCVTPPSS